MQADDEETQEEEDSEDGGEDLVGDILSKAKEIPEQKENETQEKYNLRYQLWQERLERATGRAEIIIAKQRHGPVGTANVSFDGRLTKFADLADAGRLPDSF